MVEELFASYGRKQRCRGGETCCVPLCFNNTREDAEKGLKSYTFPRDDAERRAWTQAIRRPLAWKPANHHRVCSNHFFGGIKTDIQHIPKVFPGRLPTTVPPKRRIICRQSRSTPSDLIAFSPEEIAKVKTFQPMSLRNMATAVLSQVEKRRHDELRRIQKQVDEQSKEIERLNSVILKRTLSVELFAKVDDSELFRYYTGLQDYRTFCIIYDNLFAEVAEMMLYVGNNYSDEALSSGVPCERRKGRSATLSKRNEFFMVLFRLRHGNDERDIATRFEISQGSVSRIWRSWLLLMFDRFRQLPIWPSRDTIRSEMPAAFQEAYPGPRVVLDCTEIFIEVPSSVRVQSETYSSYKHHNTAKGLVGISPHGAISFISCLYGGRMSDKAIVRHCGILDLLEPDDSVMADRGFDIEDMLAARQVELNIPAFLDGKSQMSVTDEARTRRIASVRIHVERAINRIKTFRILHQTVPLSMHRDLSRIWTVCCYLSNFLPKLIAS